MALVQDKPEDLTPQNDLDNVHDPDQPEENGRRTEVYLSGAHVHTLNYSPRGLQKLTFMVDVEVYEAGGVRFTGEDGETQIPICKVRRIGDMYLPGTQRPPSREELKAMQEEARVKAAAEKAAQEEAERAESERNEPPMFDEDGDPIPLQTDDNSGDAGGPEGDHEGGPWPGDVEFSDTPKDKK